MADPLTILGGISSILQIISSVTRLAKSLNEVRESYDNVALNTTLVASQLSTIRAALEALHAWRASDDDETEASMQLDKDLGLSLSCCAILITVIDGKLAESGYRPGIGMKQKIKYVWLEDILKEYISNLEGQVRALQLLLTIYQCRTATEKKQQLAKEESRTIIEHVRAETMTLGIGETEMDDAISILSSDASVHHLDIESILMKSPAYMKVYPEGKSPRRKRVAEPPPPPPPRRKPATRPQQSPPKPELTSQSPPPPSRTAPVPQPPTETAPRPPTPSEIAPQPPPVPPRPKRKNQPSRSHMRAQSEEQPRSQGRINVWDFLGPGQEENNDSAAIVMADSAPVFELPAGPEPPLPTPRLEEEPPKMPDVEPQPEAVSPAALARPKHLDPPEPMIAPSKTSENQSLSESSPALPGPDKKDEQETSLESPSPLEGLRHQLDMAFEEKDRSQAGEDGLGLSFSRTEPKDTLLPQDEEGAMSLDTNDKEGEPVERDLRTMSIHSGVDLYDTSVRNMSIGDDSRPPSSHSISNDECNEPTPATPVNDELDAQVEGLSILNQQLASKTRDIPVVHESNSSDPKTSGKTGKDNEDTRSKKSIEPPAEDSKPAEASPPKNGLSPQITMTPSEDLNDHQAVDVSPQIASEPEIPASPTRAPPVAPSLTAPISPIPYSFPPLVNFTRNSGVETSTASSGRDSSIFEASTISSSEPSVDNTTLTLQHSTSNTAATSTSVDAPGVAREEAQTDLRRLQSELTAAKSRGDSHAAQISLQKSIQVIRRTYLAEPTPAESKAKSPSPKLGTRANLMRFPSMPGSLKGNSALGDAAAAGEIALMSSLLEVKNVDSTSDNHKTPLMRAAINGQIDAMDVLKKYGADEFAVDKRGANVLHLAVASNRLQVVDWLLSNYPPPRPDQIKHRASILFKATDSFMSRSPRNLREASDSQGSKPLHIAVEIDQGGMMKTLLAAGVDIESKNNWGRTPLHQAIIMDHSDAFDILLQNGANVAVVDARSMSSLHWAAKTGRVDMIEKLLKKGAGRYGHDHDGNHPIHQAALGGHILAIETLLLERQDLEIRTKAGESMLHIACVNKNQELAIYMLKNCVEVNPWATPQSTLINSLSKFKIIGTSLTPLHYACCKGDYEMALLLLDHEAWVNAPTPQGATALMLATESEDTNTVNLLLKRGAKVNASMPGTLITALHIASRRGDLETVQQLCRAGANDSARANGGSYGRTPAEEAANKCTDKVKRYEVEDYFRTIRANRARKTRVVLSGERQSFDLAGRAKANTSIPPNQCRLAPWGQQNSFPVQQAQYGFQQQSPATYPPLIQQPPGMTPQQWYDPNPLTQVECPPPYQPGSSMPARLAAQAPVHRPGDSGPKYT